MDFTGIFTKRPSEYIPGLSFDRYGMAPGVNNSLLKAPTPLEMWYDLQVPPVVRQSELTSSRAEAYAQGEAIHKAILEPNLFDGGGVEQYFQYAVGQDLVSKKNVAAFEADPSRPLVTPTIIDTAKHVRDAVYKHKLLSHLLAVKNAEREMTGFAWDEQAGVMRKIRLDFRPPEGNNWNMDFKSTIHGLSINEIYHTCKKLGYGKQAAYYMDTDEMITGVRRPIFIFAFVRTVKPYMARLFQITDDPEDELFTDGRMIYKDRLQQFVNAAGEFRRRAFESHPDPEGAWEGYENEDKIPYVRRSKF